MPTEKRERQRAGREARRDAARAAQRRAQRRRQVIAIIALVAVIFAIGFVVSQSGDDETDLAADGTTTTAPGDDKPATFGTTPCPPEEGAGERTTKFEAPPENCLADGADYQATVETDVGTFVVDLAEKDAPVTANNFVFLAKHKAYDNVPFHRVIPGFVVQGGDVESGNGIGGPGYSFADELPEQGQYKVGSVAMANSGPDTNGSQFFVITGEKGVALPPNYSLFGEVTSGMDVVMAIEKDGSDDGTPGVVHKIVKVTISTKES